MISLMIATFALTQTPPATINWYPNYQEAAEASIHTGKPIFVDCYMDNCIYCEQQDKTTFKDKSVIDKINANYIPVKMKNFPKVTAFPTVIIGYPDTRIMYKKEGYHDPNAMMRALK